MLSKIGDLAAKDRIKCVGLKYRLDFDLNQNADDLRNSMQLDWIHKTKEVVLDKFQTGYMELGTFYDIKFANGANNSIEENFQKAKDLKQ